MSHPLRHFITITRHRNAVMKNCFRSGIPIQGFFHDMSKYSPAEFIPGAKYYDGKRSPHEAEREKYGYSGAWLHHKGRNKHHFEYWTDYNIVKRKAEPVKMPLKYVVEMFCDRVAASRIYKGEQYTNSSALEYFYRGRSSRVINDETSALLERLLVMLSEKGEDFTFDYIKNELLKSKDY